MQPLSNREPVLSTAQKVALTISFISSATMLVAGILSVLPHHGINLGPLNHLSALKLAGTISFFTSSALIAFLSFAVLTTVLVRKIHAQSNKTIDATPKETTDEAIKEHAENAKKLNNENERLKTELDGSKEAHKDCQRVIDEKEKALEAITTERDKFQKKYDEAMIAVNKALGSNSLPNNNSTANTDLSNELAKKEVTIKQLQEEAKTAKQMLDALNKEIAESKGILTKLEENKNQELTALQNQINLQKKDLTKQLEMVNAQLLVERELLNKLTQTIDEKTKEIGALNQNHTTELEAQTHQMAELKILLNKKAKKMQRLLKKFQSSNSKSVSFNLSLMHLKSSCHLKK